MSMPEDCAVIDLMLNIPGSGNQDWYASIAPLLMDRESREAFRMPAQYMFRDVPKGSDTGDPVAETVALMDRHGIERAMLAIEFSEQGAREALTRHPDRFFAAAGVNPNGGMEEVRRLRRLASELPLVAVTAMAATLCPQVPYDHPRWDPIYATLIELDLAFCPCVGVPGPRVPLATQKVERLDAVCCRFPELRVVMTHGAEPWEELACLLMRRHDNLFYMTSAFAPRHYPRAIVEFANDAGRGKIIYAGYYPMGLSLERIFRELPDVPFVDEVWPNFLRNNAIRALALDRHLGIAAP